MSKLGDKFKRHVSPDAERAGEGLKDILGSEIPADSAVVGAVRFDGVAAVAALAPALRKHLELPATGSVTLTADQFEHLIHDAAGAGWHNAVKQFSRWITAATDGAIQIGDSEPVEPADGIGEPQGRA